MQNIGIEGNHISWKIIFVPSWTNRIISLVQVLVCEPLAGVKDHFIGRSSVSAICREDLLTPVTSNHMTRFPKITAKCFCSRWWLGIQWMAAYITLYYALLLPMLLS